MIFSGPHLLTSPSPRPKVRGEKTDHFESKMVGFGGAEAAAVEGGDRRGVYNMGGRRPDLNEV